MKKTKKNIFQILVKYFFTGIFAIAPILLSIYIIYVLIQWIENIFYKLFPGMSLPPGVGFILIVCLLILIGFIASVSIFERLWKWFDHIIHTIPLFNVIYKSFKSVADYLNPKNKMLDGKSVMVTIPEIDCKMLGFLTREDVEHIDEKLDSDLVAVYLPMSYQVGGFTILIEKKYVDKIDMKVDKLMQGTLMAWVDGSKKDED